jgi:DNA-binding transcriptional ArsR family regulator
MSTSSERLAENADTLAWSLWTELGVSGWQRNHTSHAIDPERLLLFTAVQGDADPRLRDEATDWCAAYGRYVSAARLRNLLATQTPSTQEAFGRMAATVNANSGLRWPGATQPRPFERTKRSAIADFRAPSLIVLRLRALFGVGARAEVLRAFLADPSARLSAGDLAAEAGYTKRNVAEALEALRMAGLLEALARRNQRVYGLTDAVWLTSLPGGLPDTYPPWGSVFRILEGFLTATDRAEALPERARTVEASDALRDLYGDLLQVGVRLSEEERGPSAWPTLQRLAADLSGAWASGTPASDV